MATEEHKEMAAALGIDLSKIDWPALLAKGVNILQFLQLLLSGKIVPLPVKGTESSTCDDCKQAAFLAIQSALVSLACANTCHGG